MSYIYMKKCIGRYALALILFWVVSTAIGQPITHSRLRFSHRYRPEASAPTSDNCLIICGYSEVPVPVGLLEKIDHTGKAVWFRNIIADSLRQALYFYSVKVLRDESIIVGAILNNETPVLLKFSFDGTLLWDRVYTCAQSPSLMDVCPTSDGGIAAIALRTIFKTDSTGNLLWARSIAPNPLVALSTCYSISESQDSSLLLCGISQLPQIRGTPIQELGLLLGVSQQGTLLRSASYRATGGSVRFYSSVGIADGTTGIRGIFISDGLTQSPLLVKCDNINNIQWANKVEFFSDDEMVAIAAKDSTIVCLTSDAQGTGIPPMLHLFAADMYGDVTHVAELPNVSTSVGAVSGFAQEPLYGAVVISGDSVSGIAADFYSFDSVLRGCNINATLCISNPLPLVDTLLAPSLIPVTVSLDSLVITDTMPQAYYIQFCITNEVEESFIKKDLLVYPNPVTVPSVITIEVPLFSTSCQLILRDLTGREVYRTHREAASSGEQIQIPTTGLASGVYTVELIDASSFANVWRGKVVIE